MSDRPKDQFSPDSLSKTDAESAVQRTANPPRSDVSNDKHGAQAFHAAPPAPREPEKPQSKNGQAVELPSLSHLQKSPNHRVIPASRSAGVSSILNPSPPSEEPVGRRRKASQLESLSSGHPVLPPLSTSALGSQVTSGVRASSPMTLASSVSDRSSRRILTPRSPSVHRAASLNQLNPPTGAINAQQSPFPTSPRARAYGIELGQNGATSVPHAPTPPAVARQSYGFSAITPTSQTPRRASVGPALGPRPASESTSPRSSYSSYSQISQTSPASQYGTSSMPTLSAPYVAGADQAAHANGGVSSDRQRHVGIPISSSGSQNVYQIMSLETTSGIVQLPVDVQAASRMADEKRRRNAGASARFRQRRKEKEREASTTISRLEQEVKELREDMDFYKRERDYLAGVVLQAPGGDRHFPRPKSPNHMRNSTILIGHGASGNAGCVPLQTQAPRSPSDGRNVRRRTSALSLPPPPAPGPGANYHSNYASPSYGQPLAPQPPIAPHHGSMPLPSPLGRPSYSQPLPAPHQLMQATPQTGPWNPYIPPERQRTGPQS